MQRIQSEAGLAQKFLRRRTETAALSAELDEKKGGKRGSHENSEQPQSGAQHERYRRGAGLLLHRDAIGYCGIDHWAGRSARGGALPDYVKFQRRKPHLVVLPHWNRETRERPYGRNALW